MKELSKIEDLLVVVDMVNGFIYEGNMKDEYISRIIPRMKEVIKEYLDKLNKEIFFIRDCHKKDSLEFKKFPVHCLENTSESEIVDELKEFSKDCRVYKKNSTSAMFTKGLLDDLNKMTNLKRVSIVGCCSDICVLNFALPLVNYFDEHNKDIKVVVYEDLIETYNSENHNRDKYNEMTKLLLTQAGVKMEDSRNGRK